jgi:chromosome partitioning protein
MTVFISAVSGKGGAGKTTAVILVAGEYALQGKQVLLVDADGRQNLNEWWSRSEAKNNRPEGIELRTAASNASLHQVLEREAHAYDVVIMDSPGQDTVLRDTIIGGSDLVLTPIQPNQDEILAAGQAAMDVADTSDRLSRTIPHLTFRTRITVTGRALEAYRLIRPFIANLQEQGYDSHLLDTELYERNPYRDIRLGYGTLQMLDLTDSVRKARSEVMAMMQEIESFLPDAQRI